MIVKHQTARTMSNRLSNQEESEATIYLYSDIGGYFFDQEEWIRELKGIDADTIHLRVDSAGGDIFTARAMKTAIMQHPSKIVAHVDGVAASAASFLIMGADEIEIVDGGFIMIHNARSWMDIWGYFDFKALEELKNEVEKEIKLHDKINESIANDYVKRTGNDLETVLGWMEEETWFTASEAIENKFANRVYDGEPIENSYDLSSYVNVPESLQQSNNKLTKRELEKALRDVGISNKAARRILSEGFKDGLRDVDDTVDDPPVEETDDALRDVETEVTVKDRTAVLLVKAEALAPSDETVVITEK